MEKGLANFCRVDIINVGGFTETMKVRLSQLIAHLFLHRSGITFMSTIISLTELMIVHALQVAGWCEAHYVDLMPHNPFGPICTAACIHVGAAVPNFCAMECFQVPPSTIILGHLPVCKA